MSNSDVKNRQEHGSFGANFSRAETAHANCNAERCMAWVNDENSQYETKWNIAELTQYEIDICIREGYYIVELPNSKMLRRDNPANVRKGRCSLIFPM
jgi:hypothetical protein